MGTIAWTVSEDRHFPPQRDGHLCGTPPPVPISGHGDNTPVMKEQKQHVYAGLGHLFYSIAVSDGFVAPPETEKLKKLVKEQWMPLEPQRDSAGSDLAYYIEIGFDHANDTKMTPETAFERFKAVLAEHPEEFDESTRNLVVRTSKSIANAFAGKSKAEERMIARLEEVFK